MIQDKTILISGGTGSLGKALIKYFLPMNPRKVIVFSRDEFKQFEMKKEYNDPRIEYVIGDVRDSYSVGEAMKGVDIVIHAAALKHVNSGETYPMEVIKTNVLGSTNVASCADRYGVDKCILVSSDKAVEPLNAYGMSKGLAEKVFIAQNLRSKTRFSIVRYGNVIGSRGSILEDIFNNRPAEITITDVYMTRFWLTLQKACELVYYAIENMVGGEVFIPKIKAMDLCDVFNAVSPTSLLKATHMRPGEKLDETLISHHETRRTVENEDVFVILPEGYRGRKMGRYVKGWFKKSGLTSKNCYQKYSKREFVEVVKEYAG